MTRVAPTRRGRLLPVVLGLLLLGALAFVIRDSLPPGEETGLGAPTTPTAAPAMESRTAGTPTAATPSGPGGTQVGGTASPTPAPEPAEPPVLQVTSSLPMIGAGSAVVSGVTEHVVRLEADGRPVRLAGDGTFELRLRHLPAEGLTLEAQGADGTAVSESVELERVPSRVVPGEIRGVHVSFYGWADARLREPILEMAEQGRINTVQLDLKDESGMVGYRTGIETAHEIGAAAEIYDLADAVAQLHERGVHVVGRVVAFRDPVLARWAWDSGHRDMVIQTASGEAYGGYGGFTNFADPDVRAYNIAVAVEAAAAGVDTILWDYIRRPDGALSGFTFPGLEGSTPEEGVVTFVSEADEALRPYRVQHGASVYGIAVDRPTQIAQNIPGMAEHLDIVAPMVYPSHWNAGEYGVADPEAQPYDITLASLQHFAEVVAGGRARVVPWLQDFTLGVPYGAAEVRAQIDAAADAGLHEWLMWDPFVRYNRDAYAAESAPPNEVHLPPPPPAVPVERPT